MTDTAVEIAGLL